MPKDPIMIPLRGRGICNLIHYPLQDALTAINDIRRQKYNKELICKYSHYSTNSSSSRYSSSLTIQSDAGVSDDGDEELLRKDNFKRLFPWYKTITTSKSISYRLSTARRELNNLLRLNNALMRIVQPTAASNLPPSLTSAQQQVQAQGQAYDAQVSASQVAVPQITPPSNQTASAPESSQPGLMHSPSAKNRLAIRLQSRGNSSPWIEPPLACGNLSTPGATTYQSRQLGSATNSRSGQAHYQARTGSCSKLLPLRNEGSYEYATEIDSDSPTNSSTDTNDTNQLSPTSSTSRIILKTENPSPIKRKPSKSSRR